MIDMAEGGYEYIRNGLKITTVFSVCYDVRWVGQS